LIPAVLRRTTWAFAALAAACARAPDPLPDASRALAEGRIQDAWAAATTAAAEHPESAEAHLLLAEAALLTLRTTPGIAASDRALELAPEDSRAHLVRAFLDHARFRNVAAVAAAREAVRLAPEEARYRVGLGELLFGGGMVGTPDHVSAVAEFREALRLAPEDLRARFGLAKALVLAGNHTEGEAELGPYLEARPGHAEAWYLRGVARLRRRALDEAAEDFRQAIAHAPHEAAYWFNAANAWRLLGREAEAAGARERFETLRELEKNLGNAEVAYHSATGNVSTGLQLARALAEQGRTQKGTILLESLCLDHPELAEAQLLLAEACTLTGEIEKGRRAVARAIERAPRRARAHALLARLELGAADPEAAVEPAREAARLEPNDLEVQLFLGSVLIAAERFDEAVTLFETLRGRHPENLRAQGGLGQALVGAGRHAEGVALLTAALATRPRNVDWLYFRGLGQAGRGELGPAEGSLRSAVSIQPGREDAQAALARVLRDAGKESEAKRVEAELEERVRLEREIATLREKRAVRPLDSALARRLAELLEQSGDAAGAARTRAEADTPGGLP
jgi:tetratricopeptide (TPR) repeat protein